MVARRVKDLQRDFRKAMNEERWEEAEMYLESCISLHQRTITHESGMDANIVMWNLQLAYIKQNLNKLPDCLELYNKYINQTEIPMDRTTFDFAIALVNYAEALAANKQYEDAIKYVSEAITVLRRQPNVEEVLAAALQNLSAYYTVQKKFEEAKPYGMEAMKIFIKKLGRKNEIAKSAWVNYYNICEKLGLKEECELLENDWRTLHTPEIGGPDSLSEQQLIEIGKTLEERVHGYKSGDAAGAIKDPRMTVEELEQFLSKWQEKGLDLNEDGIDDVLDQEKESVNAAKERMDEALWQAALTQSKAASEMGEGWLQMLQQINNLNENLETVQKKLDTAAKVKQLERSLELRAKELGEPDVIQQAEAEYKKMKANE